MNRDCRKIREHILRIAHKSGHGHIPTCFSVVEMLYAVYHRMQHRPDEPSWDERDVFILSKGHASLALYCVLAHYGYFPIEEVYSFGGNKSSFGCHVDRFKVPGVEASTGSLGHGIGISVGAALGIRLRKSKQQVYTIIGDGEANEGSVWEALLVAADLGLENLTVLYDNNHSQSRALQIENPEEKLSAFGFEVVEVRGHSLEELHEAMGRTACGPRAIVANTEKGHGSKTLTENMHEWHRKSPTAEQLNVLLEELDEKAV